MVFLEDKRTTLLLILVFMTASFAFPQTNEYQTKAAFLYNFTQFVSWPDSAFSAPDMPFQLCLAGEDPFGHTLDNSVTSEKVGNHQIVVRRIQQLESSESCHMIFLAEGSEFTLKEVLSVVKDKPILIVGDEEESADKGATVGFRTLNRRIGLEINLRAARQANLTISSKLLKLSTVVQEN